MDHRVRSGDGGRQYTDAADWVANGPYGPLVTERRRATAPASLLAHVDQPAGHYPDPPLSNFSVIRFAGANGAEGRADMGAGLVGVSPPDTACDYLQHGPARLLVLGIPKAKVAGLSEQATGRPVADLGPCHRFGHDPLVEQLCLRMWDEAGGDAPAAGRFLDAALTALVSALLCRAGRLPRPLSRRNPLDRERLGRVIDYIMGHLDGSIGLADLAAVAHLSEFHFARLFKATTGQTPHQFVVQKRIEKAKQLITERRLSLVEVAAACGFSDQSGFTKHFRRVVGVTPKRFPGGEGGGN